MNALNWVNLSDNLQRYSNIIGDMSQWMVS